MTTGLVKECKDCRFWNRVKPGESQGECRVSHPTTFLIMGQDILGKSVTMTNSAFPPIDGETGWCGEGKEIS